MKNHLIHRTNIVLCYVIVVLRVVKAESVTQGPFFYSLSVSLCVLCEKGSTLAYCVGRWGGGKGSRDSHVNNACVCVEWSGQTLKP